MREREREKFVGKQSKKRAQYVALLPYYYLVLTFSSTSFLPLGKIHENNRERGRYKGAISIGRRFSCVCRLLFDTATIVESERKRDDDDDDAVDAVESREAAPVLFFLVERRWFLVLDETRAV